MRILLVGFGTRGDVQPLCVLGRELCARGYAVRVATTPDYAELVGRFGLELVQVGRLFDHLVRDPAFEPFFRGYFASPLRAIRRLNGLARALREQVTEVLLASVAAVGEADLVVYNPFAAHVGEFAREAGLPAIGVMCQPMLPSWRTSVPLFGGRDLGRIGNRASYESLRIVSVLMRRSLRDVRRRAGRGGRFKALSNPLSLGLATSPQVMAFSPALSPPPDDWPVPATVTGFWYNEPHTGETLPEPVAAFLDAGPPPIYVGFGSMHWGAERNTEVVLRALALWGGRAIIGTGPGGLKPPADLPPEILSVRGVNHALLFPRLAAVVHHGGAGTTAAALRAARPNVVLPLLGDQLFWGRRVAAVGAAEMPIPLARITPDELATRIARARTEARFAAAARDMAEAFSREPGVSAAADLVDRIRDAR